MKVFNLTDIETPGLKQRGLVNQTFAVGDKLLSPGASEDIDDETLGRVRPELQHMVHIGMAALGDLPADYSAAKAKSKPEEKKVAFAPPPESSGEETPAPQAKRGGR